MSIRRSLRSACGDECALGHIGDGDHHRHITHRHAHHSRTPGSQRMNDTRERKIDITEYVVHSIAGSGEETNRLGSIFFDDEFADLSLARRAIQYAKFPSSPEHFQFISNIGTPIGEEYESKHLVSSIADVNNSILIEQMDEESDDNSENEIEESTKSNAELNYKPVAFSEDFKRRYGDRGREIIQRAKDSVRNLSSKQETEDDIDNDRGRDIIKRAREQIRNAKLGAKKPSRRYDSLERLYERLDPREVKSQSRMWRVIKQYWIPVTFLLLLLFIGVYHFDQLKRFLFKGNAAVLAVMISSLLFYVIVTLCRGVTTGILPRKFHNDLVTTVILLVLIFPIFVCIFVLLFGFTSHIFEKASRNITNINSTEGDPMEDTYFSDSY